jgi:hypothetical protein
MLFNYNYFSDDKTIDKKNNYKSATIATLGFLDPKMCGKSYGKALSNKPKIIWKLQKYEIVHMNSNAKWACINNPST